MQMILSLSALVLSLLSLSGGDAEPATLTAVSAHEQSESCPIPPSDSVFISTDSIGLLPIRATIAELRQLCPAARDTVILGEGGRIPSVAFPLRDLIAIAVQHEVGLVERNPPDAWLLQGQEGYFSFAEGLSLQSTWGQLRDAMGDAIGDAGGGVVEVTFCTEKTVTFALDADATEVGSIEVTGELWRIPETAKIRQVSLLTTSNYYTLADHRCP